MIRWFSGLVGFLAIALAWSLPVWAQSDDLNLDRNLRDEITVTATRREIAVRLVPSNITQMDADELRFIKPRHISESLNRMAGLGVHRGNGQEHLTAVRSPVLTAGAGAGSFLYLQDGVPLRAAGFANINGLFEAHGEVARGLEVVRGPGSVLYGSNAVHGLINVLTPKPHEGGGLEMSWGRYGRGQTSGWLGTESYLAAVTLSHENGYRQAAGLDQQKVTLRYDWSGADRSLAVTFSGHNLNQETAGFVRGTDAYKDSGLARINPNPQAYRDAKALRFAARYEQNLNDAFTLALTPYARWNEMEFLMHFLPSQAKEENGHKSIGLLSTLYWEKEKADLIFGFDIEHSRGTLNEVQTKPTIFSYTQGLHYDYEATANVAALYAQGDFELAPGLHLVAGLRGEYTGYEYDNKADTIIVGRFQRLADRRDDFFTLTPKLGLLYSPSSDFSAFINYARGARAPQTTDLYRLQSKQVVGEVNEEELDSVEVGVRGVVRDVQYQLSVYAMKKRNFFFRDSDGFNVTNGKTQHWGVELEASKAFGETVEVSLSTSYARHRYDFDNDVSANSTESIAKGDDVDSAPRLMSNMRLAWRPAEGVRVEAEWVHMGRYYMDASNAHTYPGHDLINVRAAWDLTDDVEIFGALRNVTNTDYAERADFSFGSERYFPGEERAAEIGLRLRF